MASNPGSILINFYQEGAESDGPDLVPLWIQAYPQMKESTCGIGSRRQHQGSTPLLLSERVQRPGVLQQLVQEKLFFFSTIIGLLN